MDEPNASSAPRADVPVYNCHVLVAPRDAEGWVVARSSNLPEVTARGRSEREALANVVAAFKAAIGTTRRAIVTTAIAVDRTIEVLIALSVEGS